MADAARKLRIIGYSERGITNSLFYEISYSSQPVSLLEKLLSLVRFPYVGQQSIRISSAKILIEQSFSDFGDADVVLLTETGTQHVSIFLEAKVKSSQRSQWTIEEEFNKFCKGLKSTVSSSNLFTQLYYKARLVNALKKGGIQAVQKGIPFPPSSSKPIRKIGNNEVVLRGVEQLLDYLDAGFYVVLVPDSPERVAEFFCDDMLKNTALQEYPEWDVSNYGYICWSEIKGFCSQYNLENTLGVFTFNEGQIY